jgi:FMN reductase
MKILAVCASPRVKSHSRVITDIAVEAARAEGAEVEILNLAETPLPLYSPTGVPAEHQESVDRVAQMTLEANAFLLTSPEYHGSMTNVAKNYFDFHYHEFSGKLFGLLAATGGSQGTSCLTHMRASVQYCHGWSLPYQVAVSGKEFTRQEINNPKAIDRIKRIGRDTSVYGRMLCEQFNTDITNPEVRVNTFAGWHVEALGIE